MSWTTIESSELDEKFTYAFEQHSPIKTKGFPWIHCKHCGLLYLNNKFTKWAIKKGCLNNYHKDYKRMRNGN